MAECWPLPNSWNTNNQCDGIWRWCLWEVTRSSGWSPQGPYKKKHNLSLLYEVIIVRRLLRQTRMWALTRNWISQVPLSWTPQPPELWEIKGYCSSHPVSGTFAIAVWTKTTTDMNISYWSSNTMQDKGNIHSP